MKSLIDVINQACTSSWVCGGCGSWVERARGRARASHTPVTNADLLSAAPHGDVVPKSESVSGLFLPIIIITITSVINHAFMEGNVPDCKNPPLHKS